MLHMIVKDLLEPVNNMWTAREQHMNNMWTAHEQHMTSFQYNNMQQWNLFGNLIAFSR